MKFLWLLLIPCFAMATQLSADKESRREKIEQLVIERELTQGGLTQLLLPNLNRPNHDCDIDDYSCVEEGCKRLGSFGCDDTSELREMARACRGNINGRCLEAACDRLSSIHCNEMSEVTRLARACRPVYGGQCVHNVCSLLSSIHCNEISEIERVAGACRGLYDGQCIKDVCGRLGSLSCNELSEIEEVAEICRGNDS